MPASGKSTAVKMLLEQSNGKIQSITDIRKKHNKLSVLINKVNIFLSTLALFIKIRNKKAKSSYELFKFIYGHKLTWTYVNASSSEHILIDEGVAQKSLSIIMRTNLDLKANCLKLYNILSKDRSVTSQEVFITADFKIIKERKQIRNDHQDINRSDEISIEKEKNMFENIINQLNAQKSITVFRNNTKNDLDEIVTSILKMYNL